MNVNIIAALDSELDSDDKKASYTGADEDQCCAVYLAPSLHKGEPMEFVELTVTDEGGAVPLVHSRSSSSYHVFETEAAAIDGFYVGKDEWDEEDPDLDSLEVSLAESSEEEFEAVIEEEEEAKEDEASALLGGESDDEEEEEVSEEEEVDELLADD